jgi:hypothetical protein
MDLVDSPFGPTFKRFLDQIHDSCLISSPFITAAPISQLISAVAQKRLQDSIEITLVTDLSIEHLVGGSTDVRALLSLTEHVQNVSLVYLPRIHAKVYVSGTRLAIITSANMTEGGLFRNFEYGVSITDPALVAHVRSDVERYATLGGRVTRQRLAEIGERVEELRTAIEQERLSIKAQVRRAALDLERRARDDLLRARVAGRSITGVFADTILYVLRNGPLSTASIHARIREIHPDLCDDSIDRVIDGERFGRLWKHHVRNAQQQLKRAGLIDHRPASRAWHRTPAYGVARSARRSQTQ